VELLLDCIEQCWDRVWPGKVCFEGEKPFGGLGATPTPRRNRDLVAVAGELLSNGGTNPGPSSENKYNMVVSVGLQGSCILFLGPHRFNLTIGSRRLLFQATVIFQATAIYSRLPFSCRLPFRSITDYLTHGNTLIYLYLDLQSESNHLSLHLVLILVVQPTGWLPLCFYSRW
jgi:hypothetical protein